jgi:hypothetical protein
LKKTEAVLPSVFIIVIDVALFVNLLGAWRHRL